MNEIAAGLGTANSRESRIQVTINAVRDMIMEAENTNNRLIALKARVQGIEEDAPPIPINKVEEPTRPLLDELDTLHSRLHHEIGESKRHLVDLEGL